MNTLDGKLPENILLFTRLLRAAGIRIGAEGVTDSIEAIQILEDVKKLDVVATLMENHFNNQISIQLNIKDIKPYTSPS